MLKRVRIVGYKSFQDLVVVLKPLSVLFGPNGAGKSNFLDALQLLSKLATTRTLKEAFDPPHRGKPLESFAFPPDGMKGLLESDRRRFTIEVDVELSDAVVEAVNRQILEMKRTVPPGKPGKKGEKVSRKMPAVKERYLRYRIEVEILPKSGILRVADEYLTALNNNGQPTKRRNAFLERVGDRLHLRMEGQAHPRYYERYLDHAILSLPHYPPHHPHLVAVREEFQRWLFFYFEPRERMRMPNPVKEVRHIGLMGEDLAAYLNTLKALDPPQFRAVERALKALLPHVDGIELEVNDLGEVELRLREGGIPVPARVVSEGTLRLLGLLSVAGAKEQPSLVGFEEPENGVHPRRIELVAEFLKTRAVLGETQYIITTHSPLLPDKIPDEYLFICRKGKQGTEIVPFSAWGPLARRSQIDEALRDEHEPPQLSVSERLLRGDFDA